jgi:hypothetical protein
VVLTREAAVSSIGKGDDGNQTEEGISTLSREGQLVSEAQTRIRATKSHRETLEQTERDRQTRCENQALEFIGFDESRFQQVSTW